MADTIKITTLAQLKVALQAAKTYIDGQIGGLSTSGNASQFGTFSISHQAAALDFIHLLTQLGSHSGGLDIVADAKRVNHLGDISHDGSFLISTTDTGKDTIQASDVISHLCGTRGVTQNPVSDLLQGIVRLVSTSHDLCDFLRRDSAYRLAGILTDQGVDSSLSSLAVDQSLQSSSQIIIGDLTLACHSAQANVIEKIKVNGTEVTPAAEDKSIALTIPTGKLAGKDIVAEADLDTALKEKVNAAAEGNHSHANKAFLDTLSGATDEEVTAMCTEVFGA